MTDDSHKVAEHKYVIVTAVIIVLLFGTIGVYYDQNLTYILAQEEDSEDQGNSGDQRDVSEEEADATNTPSEGILTYVDSQGRFSIGYPADAVIMPLEGIPGGVVSISSPGFQNVTSIDLRIADLADTDIELEEHVSSVLAGLENSSIPNFKAIQTAECEKYSLAGEQVCSIIYNADAKSRNGLVLRNATVMQLYSAQDNSLYNIAYSAPGEEFDNNLRILVPMLNSFTLLDGQDDLTPIPRFHNLTSS